LGVKTRLLYVCHVTTSTHCSHQQQHDHIRLEYGQPWSEGSMKDKDLRKEVPFLISKLSENTSQGIILFYVTSLRLIIHLGQPLVP
jgi:hypothetical protein